MAKLSSYVTLRDFVTEIFSKYNGTNRQVSSCDNGNGTWSVVVTIDGVPHVSKDYGYVGMEDTCKDVAEMYELGSIFYI